MSVGHVYRLYGVFLGIQTLRHRDYLISPDSAGAETNHEKAGLHDGILWYYARPAGSAAHFDRRRDFFLDGISHMYNTSG